MWLLRETSSGKMAFASEGRAISCLPHRELPGRPPRDGNGRLPYRASVGKGGRRTGPGTR